MSVQLPRRSQGLWLIAILLMLGVIPVVIYSGRIYYAEGGDSPDAPGMLLASVIFMMPLFLAIWMAIVWGYLHDYRGGAVITKWRCVTGLGRGLSIAAVLASAFFVWAIFWRVDYWRFSRLPFVLFLLAWAVFFQILRIAAVARDNERGEDGYSRR